MTLRRCQRNSVDRRRKPGRSPSDQQPPPRCAEHESVQAANAAKERPSRERWGFAAGAKLGTYDGSTCVETFLARFRHCARYFRLTAEDQFFQLCASLSGPTGQILWDTGAQQTAEEVMVLLRSRFGDVNQAERFRAELRRRRRYPGESLQKLYHDICRLMALALSLIHI